jgi:hypothetical protein
MCYSVGSRIRVKLYSGKEVEAEVTSIMDQSSGSEGANSFWQRDNSNEP